MKSLSVTIQMKALHQYFPMVLFVLQYISKRNSGKCCPVSHLRGVDSEGVKMRTACQVRALTTLHLARRSIKRTILHYQLHH